MITFNDVKIVVVESYCRDFCNHSARITLNDRRTRAIPSDLISAVISGLAKERINPNQKWTGEEVKRHFKYKRDLLLELPYEPLPDDQEKTSPEEILNSLFSGSSCK